MAEAACASSSCSEEADMQCVKQILDMAYEMQYFGFHPRSFTDGVYKVLFDYLQASITSFQNLLIEKFSDILPEEEIKVRTQLLFNESLIKLNDIIDKLEVFTYRNIFKIPDHVVLPDDEIHETNPRTQEDMDTLDAEIEEVTERLRLANLRNSTLKEKVQEQGQLLEKLKKVQNVHEYVMTSAKQNGVGDIEANIGSFLENAANLCEKILMVQKSASEMNSLNKNLP